MPKMFEKRASQKRVQKERILTKQIVIYISCFLISWTPYALASFYTVLTDFKLSPLLSLFPALFAKSSLVWSSLFYLLSNNQITKKVYTLFGMKNFQDASVPNENTLSEKSSLIYNYWFMGLDFFISDTMLVEVSNFFVKIQKKWKKIKIFIGKKSKKYIFFSVSWIKNKTLSNFI